MKILRLAIVVCAMLFLGSCSRPDMVLITNECKYPVEIQYLSKEEIGNDQNYILLNSKNPTYTIINSRQQKEYYLNQFLDLQEVGEVVFKLSRKNSNYTYSFPKADDPSKFLMRFSHGGRFGHPTYIIKIDEQSMYIQDSDNKWIQLERFEWVEALAVCSGEMACES